MLIKCPYFASLPSSKLLSFNKLIHPKIRCTLFSKCLIIARNDDNSMNYYTVRKEKLRIKFI